MRSAGGTLWVTDIDEVVAIEIASGKVSAKVKVDGSTFLNDLATAPDGTVYASDSNNSTIYAVKDGKSSVFVTLAVTGGGSLAAYFVAGALLLLCGVLLFLGARWAGTGEHLPQ